MQIILLLY